MNIKLIITCLILSMFTMGCIDSIKSQTQKSYISLSFDEVDAKINACDTEIKCAEFVNSQLINKYIKWTGKVVEVNDNEIMLMVDKQTQYNVKQIKLLDVDKSEKLKLNKGSIIRFSGRFNMPNEFYIGMDNPMRDYKMIWDVLTSMHVPDFYTHKTHLEITDGSIIYEPEPTEPSITSGISKISSDVPKSKTFDISYKKINDSYIQIIVKNIGKETVSNFNFNIGSQSSPVLGNLNPGDYLSFSFNIKEILGKDNNIDVRIFYVWSGHPNSEVLRVPITT